MAKRKRRSKKVIEQGRSNILRPAGNNSSVVDMDLHGNERRNTNRGFIELVNS